LVSVFFLLFLRPQPFTIIFANLFPEFQASYAHFSWLGKRGMVMALFLIGSNITVKQIRQSGVKSFAPGITLWAITAFGSLFILTF